MFAYVYMILPYQNYPLHSPPSLPAPTASEIPYPAPINIYYIPPVTPAAIQACDSNLAGGQLLVWINQPCGQYPGFDIEI